MLRVITFLLLATITQGLDLSKSIKSGRFWERSIHRTFQPDQLKPKATDLYQLNDIQLGALQPQETRLYTTGEETPSMLRVTLYESRKNTDITETRFNELVDTAKKQLDALSGTSGTATDSKISSTQRLILQWDWEWDTGRARLSVSPMNKKSKKTYIRILLAPADEEMGDTPDSNEQADMLALILQGSFWNQDIETSLPHGNFTRPDSHHIRTHQFKIGQLPTGETLITLRNEKPSSMQIMLYNKGDNKAIDGNQFKTFEKKVIDIISIMTGVNSSYQGGGKHGGIIKSRIWEWKWNNGCIRMESSTTGSGRDFQGEFIRLHIAPDAKAFATGTRPKLNARKNHLEHLTTDDDGTVWIKDIPMIDQGSKGYCVPATISRVLNLYGIKVDQHIMAQICDTGAKEGTDGLSMINAMKLVSKKYHIDFKILEDYESIVKPLIKPYNRIARREDKPLVSYQTYNVFSEMDPDILLQIRADKTSKVDKWLKRVKKHIDNGTPIIWNIPDHVRLIIGYNMADRTIIYSDSWGEEHAKSVMPAANALAMTNGLFLISPN